MSDTYPSISHADYLFGQASGLSHDPEDELTSRALANLAEFYPASSLRHDELAKRLSGLVVTEQTRRNAHYYRYRAMLRIAGNMPLFTHESENVAETSLLDFYTRLSLLDEDGFTFAGAIGGKGIATELGHVDQLGNWQSGRELDQAIRDLPHSSALAAEGFLFGDTYDSRSNARIDYKFHLTDTTSRSRGVNVKGVRKRAAADVLTEDGNVFEIVKQSTFLIDVKALNDEQRALLGKTLQLQGQYAAAKEQYAEKKVVNEIEDRLDMAMLIAGDTIIEPFLTNPENRQRSTSVLAATSLYFALYRH